MRSAEQHEFRGGTGEPLVLLHGATSSWKCWRDVIPLLTDTFDVFAPTLPGHGGLPRPSRPHSISDLADEVEAQLDAAGIDNRPPGRQLPRRLAGRRAGDARQGSQRRRALSCRRLASRRESRHQALLLDAPLGSACPVRASLPPAQRPAAAVTRSAQPASTANASHARQAARIGKVCAGVRSQGLLGPGRRSRARAVRPDDDTRFSSRGPSTTASSRRLTTPTVGAKRCRALPGRRWPTSVIAPCTTTHSS